MDITIEPGERAGCLRAPGSKSYTHRLLLLAAVGREEVAVDCGELSDDAAATAECLSSLGARADLSTPGQIRIAPLREPRGGLLPMPCGQSGATLRFLLPLAGALGVKCVFDRRGRLGERPLSPLDRQLEEHGMSLRAEGALLYARGTLGPGDYELPGNISSQYISGLLMALPLLNGDSTLRVTGRRESEGYIAMTEKVLSLAGIRLEATQEGWRIPGGQTPALPGRVTVEGDWSSAAPFLCMGALSSRGVCVTGLAPDSAQGDRAIGTLLREMGALVELKSDSVTVRRGSLRGIEADAAQIPDLIPTLCALAAFAEGETRVINAGRLRLKESDRLAATAALIRSLGGEVRELPEGLVIRGGGLAGGRADSAADHRIAMAAAVAAGGCAGPVRLAGAECVAKSYPRFWQDFASLKEVSR